MSSNDTFDELITFLMIVIPIIIVLYIIKRLFDCLCSICCVDDP